jgi:hypothetical protein
MQRKTPRRETVWIIAMRALAAIVKRVNCHQVEASFKL